MYNVEICWSLQAFIKEINTTVMILIVITHYISREGIYYVKLLYKPKSNK